jgi:hypothetical protein
MRKIYICHPYSDNPYANEQHLVKLCSEIVERSPENIPIAPQIYLTRFMDDSTQREQAMAICIQLALMCDEVWVCSEPGEESPGMKQEIEACEEAGVPMVWVPWLRRGR